MKSSALTSGQMAPSAGVNCLPGKSSCYRLTRCQPQPQHAAHSSAGSSALTTSARAGTRVAAAAEPQVVEPAADTSAPAAAAAAAATAETTPAVAGEAGGRKSTSRKSSSSSSSSSKGKARSGQQTQAKEGTARAIIVKDKPVTYAIIKRLQEVPQAVLRAASPDDNATYKAVTAVAAAQAQLAASNRVVVYVPYTRASQFTAQLLTADASVVASGAGSSREPLVAKSTTDAAALGNTLAFALLREGGASVASAGAVSTAKVAEALRVARRLLLSKGFEIGVVPQFTDGKGPGGQQITIVKQDVVVQELPPPEVVAPQNANKSLAATAAATASLLDKQRRCRVKVPQGQLSRLTELLDKVYAVQQGEKPATAGVQAVQSPGAGAEGVQQQQQQRGGKQRSQAAKQRLLLVSYTGTSTSSSPAAAAAQTAATTEAAGEASPAAPTTPAAAAAGTNDPSDTAALAAAAAGSTRNTTTYVGLELMRSRFGSIPIPQLGLAGPQGPLFAKKPVSVTADSAVAGAAGALESKLIRFGAAWLYSDGSVAGNRIAWEAYVSLAKKLSGSRGDGKKSPVLALVRTERSAEDEQQEQEQEQKGGTAAEVQQEQQPAGVGGGDADAKEAVASKAAAAAAAGRQRAGYSLSMLVVADDDVPRSIMQAPNAPLESSKVGYKQSLQLIKFAAAANSFLPTPEGTGAGGLVLLPAVLPAASSSTSSGRVGDSGGGGSGSSADAAVDYRFMQSSGKGAGSGSSGSGGSGSSAQPAYDYFFRVQRYTQTLPGGMAGPDVQQLRVSPTTDPSKLRDAIVAKMLQNQPATLRFATSAGALPAQMLTVAMTAVAAARVRLQSKRADVDVGVMPQVLPPDSDANAAAASAGGGSRAGGSNSNKRSNRAGQQVIYSLRLVPMPAAAAAAQPAAAAPAAPSAAADGAAAADVAAA